MAIAATFNPSTRFNGFSKINHHRPSFASPFSLGRIASSKTSISASSLTWQAKQRRNPVIVLFSAGGGGSGGNGGKYSGGGGGGGGGNGGRHEGEESGDKNKEEAILALAEVGRSLDSLPSDLASAIQDGRIPGSIVFRYLELEKSGFFRWLLQFGGFKERLLADDLFLFKVFMECGVGIFTKTAAEWERRRENFVKELDFVLADVFMAIIADFMLVYLPAPTVSLRPALAVSAGSIAKFFHNCPDNAFQIALAGSSYSFLQRIGAILRNGIKLFAVGTTASLVGTGVTNALIRARKAVAKDSDDESEEVPLVATSVAYGVYMAVSSNLRYQILAGVIEQRIMEPLLHNHKVVLSALCFAVRTGNTFLGSLLWVDYARLVGTGAYGVYKAISSNPWNQMLAGVIGRWVMGILAHHHKAVLSARCFARRTGNYGFKASVQATASIEFFNHWNEDCNASSPQ